MKHQFANQWRTMFWQGLKVEWASPERLISPLLFAITVLVLFSFAMGQIEPKNLQNAFVTQTYLTAFLALQISFSRTFEPETRDKVFQLLKTYPLSRSAWFCAKFTQVLVLGAAVLIPTIIFAAFFLSDRQTTFLNPMFFLVAVLALAGLAALGVLLSAMTLSSGARQILYPILYFPLTTPVLLAAVESSRILFNNTGDDLLNSWLALLVINDILYFVLGILLFGELVQAE